jgi:hypothetical protein
MSQLREAVIKGRDAFLRELTKQGSLVFYLSIGSVVALVNLIEAYRARSVFSAIKTVGIWLILAPLLAHWMRSKRSR